MENILGQHAPNPFGSWQATTSRAVSSPVAFAQQPLVDLGLTGLRVEALQSLAGADPSDMGQLRHPAELRERARSRMRASQIRSTSRGVSGERGFSDMLVLSTTTCVRRHRIRPGTNGWSYSGLAGTPGWTTSISRSSCGGTGYSRKSPARDIYKQPRSVLSQ